MQNIEFGIDCDSRVALVGPNGAGVGPHAAATSHCLPAVIMPVLSLPGAFVILCDRQRSEKASKWLTLCGHQAGGPTDSLLSATTSDHLLHTVCLEEEAIDITQSSARPQLTCSFTLADAPPPTPLVCCRKEYAAEAHVRRLVPNQGGHQKAQPPHDWPIPPALCGCPG